MIGIMNIDEVFPYRMAADERERAEQRSLTVELKLSELLTQVNSILLVDDVNSKTHEQTINAVSSLRAMQSDIFHGDMSIT